MAKGENVRAFIIAIYVTVVISIGSLVTLSLLGGRDYLGYLLMFGVIYWVVITDC